MGNRTKASQACLTNLSKALEKSCKATVKNHSDTDDLDYTPDSDMEDLGSEGSEFDDADITDDAQGFDRCGGGMGQLENIIDIIHY